MSTALFGAPAWVANAAPDEPTCFGETPTITGTEDGDTLEGTEGDDVIVGLEGDDIIRGLGGNDLICGAWDGYGEGTPEQDALAGGDGDDTLLGTESSSSESSGWASGDDGDDLLQQTAVSYKEAPRGVVVDLVAGTGRGWGRDTLVDVVNLRGSRFNDQLFGNDEGVDPNLEVCACDVLIGLAGDDLIRARKGYDRVVGSAGDDLLYGGKGSDELRPGKGTDDVRGGGDGQLGDRVSYFTDTAAVVIDLKAGAARGRGLDALTSIEDAQGTRFADEIWGDANVNDLSGAAGRDELHGRAGRDRLFGDEGRDQLFGGRGRDLGIGGPGTDTCRTENQKSCEN